MKRILVSIAAACIFASGAYAQTEYHVSPLAVKNGKGTLASPFNSIQAAQKKITKVNKRMQEDITVYLHGGTYTLSEPLTFTEKDGGKNGHTITYKAYQNEKPVISGGVQVKGWEHVGGPIYKASLNSDQKLRTLFINGKRQRMAGLEKPIHGLGSWGSYTVKGDKPWIYAEGTGFDGIKFSTKDVRIYKNPDDVELIQCNVWTEKILCLRDIQQVADTTILKLQQPYGAIVTNFAWAAALKYQGRFVVRNAYELLDTPGEFYFDRRSHTLYIYGKGIDLDQAEVIAPISDGLMRIQGSSTQARVENLRFENLAFMHDHWGLHNIKGSHAFAGVQSAGIGIQFVPGGNWHPTHYNCVGVPRGTVEVHNAKNIVFEHNRFEQLSSAIAVNYVNDVTHSTVNGNYFHDLLGNSVNVGHPQHYKIGDGDLFAPEVEGLCSHIDVTNNYVRNVSLDFRQLEGITAFFVADVHIDHNDVAGTPYGAITMGWWWGNSEIPPSKVAKNNSMSFNKAGNSHLVLKDGGILYTLGEQPNSKIEGNYIYNGPRSIYPDDGSAYFTIQNNVIDNARRRKEWLFIWRDHCHDLTVKDNYVRMNRLLNNGTNCPMINTKQYHPKEKGEEQRIIKAAGLQAAYKHLILKKEPKRILLYPASFKDVDHVGH